MNTKRCFMCNQEKLYSEFMPSAFIRGDYRCRTCATKRAYKWREKNVERYNIIRKRGERKYLLKNYGVTPKWYENKLRKQNYRCAICGSDSNGIMRNKLDVDHDHITGKVRGILCNRCNTGLGQFKDNLQLMQKAIEYLTLYSKSKNT